MSTQEQTIVVPVDEIIHTEDHPFCSDWQCPCHANVEAINVVTSQLMDGLLSWHEAQLILRGDKED